MPHFEVGFSLQHDCPLNNLSRKFPSAVLAWWSNFDQDILEVTFKDPDSPQYQDNLQRAISFMGGHVARHTSEASKIQLVVGWEGEKYEYRTSRLFTRNNCLVLQPTVHTQGWEWYRVIAFSEKDMKALFKELDSSCHVEILSKETVDEGTLRDTLAITTSSILGGLTGNQASALVVALESGYYDVPKKATTVDVAARLGLPRTTFEERLRKAESKVLRSVAPYMRLKDDSRRFSGMTAGRPRERSRGGPGDFGASDLSWAGLALAEAWRALQTRAR